MNIKHLFMGLLLTALAVIAAACDSGTTTLPTLAVIPSATVGESTPEAAADETEAATEAVLASTDVPLPTQTELFAPIAEGTEATQAVPIFSPQPTTDISTIVEAVDLSNVEVGTEISLFGTLTIEGSSVIVTDGAGQSVRLDMPTGLAELLVDKQVFVVGLVTSTEGGILLAISSIQEMDAPPTGVAVGMPSVESTPDSLPPALPTFASDVRIEANLTALEAYDQLIGQIGGAQLGDRIWISVSGNPTAGWSYSFYSPTDSSVVIYLVLPDGTIQNQLGIPPIGLDEVVALERDALTVDSDGLLATYSAEGGTEDPETLVLLLQLTDEDGAQWSVLDSEGVELMVVDAISGEVVP